MYKLVALKDRAMDGCVANGFGPHNTVQEVAPNESQLEGTEMIVLSFLKVNILYV